jgi:hypothetical protein
MFYAASVSSPDGGRGRFLDKTLAGPPLVEGNRNGPVN